MERIDVSKISDTNQVVARAVEVLRAGGIIIYPTETAYGIGVDAMNDSAVRKVYELKKRLPTKPFHVIVFDVNMAKRYVEWTPLADKLCSKYMPGPLTLVLNKRSRVSDVLTGGLPTLGIRMPANKLCLDLARALNAPYTATSANVSNESTCYSVSDVLSQFGAEIDSVALILDAGVLPKVLPSTVVDATGDVVRVLRVGPVVL